MIASLISTDSKCPWFSILSNLTVSSSLNWSISRSSWMKVASSSSSSSSASSSSSSNSSASALVSFSSSVVVPVILASSRLSSSFSKNYQKKITILIIIIWYLNKFFNLNTDCNLFDSYLELVRVDFWPSDNSDLVDIQFLPRFLIRYPWSEVQRFLSDVVPPPRISVFWFQI